MFLLNERFLGLILLLISTLVTTIVSIAWFRFKTLNPGRIAQLIELEMDQLSNNRQRSLIDDKELWNDLDPIPQVDSERPMVQIVYSTKYRRAMEIFRALLKRNEHSERALLLTTEILKSNPSHYPVWTYRLQILKGLNSSNPDGNHLRKELKFLSKVMPQIRKSFQAWTHRFSIVLLINDPSDELEFVNSALECDYKNYHSWTYRQNLLYTFKRPEMWEGELDFITDLIEKDLRNNSAWNHRFFISFESFKIREHDKDFLSSSDVLDSVVQREIQYTKDQIFKSPNNPSAWNYLRGVLKRGSVSFNDLRDFVIPLTKRREELELMGWPEELNLQSQLPAVGAVEFLADIYLLDQKQSQSANDLFKLLADELDPIRKNYWSYRSKTSFSLSS